MICQTMKLLPRNVSSPGLALPCSLLLQLCRSSDARPGSFRLCTETRKQPDATVSAPLVSSRRAGVLWAACTRPACCCALCPRARLLHSGAFSSVVSWMLSWVSFCNCPKPVLSWTRGLPSVTARGSLLIKPEETGRSNLGEPGTIILDLNDDS